MDREKDHVHFLLITQNIGGIECDTEDVTPENKQYTSDWIKSVKEHISTEEARHSRPVDVVVLHMQEVGGKKFNRSFVSFLGASIHNCSPFSGGWSSGLLMSDEDDGTFTAMATAIFVSPRIVDVCSLLSFRHRVFVCLNDGPLQWTKTRKALFHGAKFSEAGTSRKGYLLTALRVGTRIFNFLNFHLFHDADNAVAAKSTPSEYAIKRQGAIAEALNEISPVVHSDDPLFIFGDFNFRLEIQRFTAAMQTRFSQTITFGKKKVSAPDAVWRYVQDPANWEELRTFDSEAAMAIQHAKNVTGVDLAELPRSFGPTYLIETDPKAIKEHATTEGAVRSVFQRDRLPAWCDRVWLNSKALAITSHASYNSVPLHLMDHFPVQLSFLAPLL